MGSAIVTYEQEIYANATMHDASAASNEACQARERYGPSFRPVKPGPCYAAGITFEDAADVIRRGLGVGPESFSEGLTQESSLRPQLNQLAEWAERNALWLEIEVAQRIQSSPVFGSEHFVFPLIDSVDGKTLRMWKSTKGGFGKVMKIVKTAQSPKHWFNLDQASPLEYFTRMVLINELSPELETRLEGFALEAGVVRVVTSQLFVPSPSTPTNLGLIEKFFGDLEFEPLLMSNWAYSGWYHRAKDVAIFDATEDNLLHFNRGLHPVDVIPLKPNPTQRELILQTLEVPIALR